MRTSTRPSTMRLLKAIDAEIERCGEGGPPMLWQQMRDLASRDYYHDFYGEPKFPITALIKDAYATGMHSIRELAINGEFDSGPEEDTGGDTDD